MLRTLTPVQFDTVDLNKTAIVYAEPSDVKIDGQTKQYIVTVREFINEEYIIDDITYQRKTILRTASPRLISFEQANSLRSYIDANYSDFLPEDINEREWKYIEIGHLLVNLEENIRSVGWELVNEL